MVAKQSVAAFLPTLGLAASPAPWEQKAKGIKWEKGMSYVGIVCRGKVPSGVLAPSS